MVRKIISINEDLCNGCGECVIGCSEGAIEIINGKAKLVKEEFCDGFGDCLGECPTGAITIHEKESNPFSIELTKEHLLKTKGVEAVWKMEDAMERHEIKENNGHTHGGCPSSKPIRISPLADSEENKSVESKLRNWPVQIHLVPVSAPYYKNANLLIAADCCSFAYGNFHSEFIKDHITMIGCPKLDNVNIYLPKLTQIFRDNDINSVSVAFMEVPCCMGIVNLVENAIRQSGKNIPVTKVQIGVRGDIIGKN
jgi:Fe-S-cluster-containing hydrogenase component 2